MLTQVGLPTDYGSEELCGQLRQVLVRDLNVLSLFNGQLSVSKAGPKSAEDPNFTKEKVLGKIAPPSKSYVEQDLESVLDAKDMHLAKSRRASIHLKHLASEILVLLASN